MLWAVVAPGRIQAAIGIPMWLANFEQATEVSSEVPTTISLPVHPVLAS
jgi:hypothetical protein